jgi:hypothetical protein
VQVYEPNPSGQYITISMIDEGKVIGQTGFAARYTHQQLGSMIGSNREAVTRAPKRLREEGGGGKAASDPRRGPASPEADRRGTHLQKNCQPTEEWPEARGGDGINPARLVRGVRCIGGLGSYHLAGLTFVEVHLGVHLVSVI